MTVSTTPARARTQRLDDELVRETRERVERGRLERNLRLSYLAVGGAFVVAAALCALLLHQGPDFSPATALLFLVVYTAVSRVEFEIGTGSALPTQLVLVPMLFALPLGAVPAVVGCALILRSTIERRPSLRSGEWVLPALASGWHAVGPVLVIAALGGLPLRWSAWPVYLLALAAQFTFDFASAAVSSGIGHGVPLRTLARFLGWVDLVDASLAPIGLAIAFATQDELWLVALVLPLVGLLRHFAQERQRRIDHALELSDAYRGTAFLLGDVVEADDAYTGSHSRHVVDLVLDVCDDVGLDGAARRDAEFVALLHDVGKIRIPGEIINKPGPLDADERAVMETHTIEGERMLDKVGGLLGHVGHVVRSCHERWDGQGYPDGLAGEQIPLVARIVCACDAFSAMTTDRPYRKARSKEEALAELRKCSGSHFDPQVVDALLRVSAGG